MPAYGDFGSVHYADGVLTISLAPPVAIGGQTFQTVIAKRFEGTPLVTRNMASGFYGVSGMNIQTSGAGIMTANLNASDLSGYDPGNFSVQVKRMDSGSMIPIFQGYVNVFPGNV